jgi:hypothetical protein
LTYSDGAFSFIRGVLRRMAFPFGAKTGWMWSKALEGRCYLARCFSFGRSQPIKTWKLLDTT